MLIVKFFIVLGITAFSIAIGLRFRLHRRDRARRLCSLCTCPVAGQQQLEAVSKVVVREARRVAGASDASDLQDPAAAQLVQDHARLEQPGNRRLVGLDAPDEMQL